MMLAEHEAVGELANASGLASLQCTRKGACPARSLIFLKELARVRGLGPCTCPCAWHSIPAGRDMWLIV